MATVYYDGKLVNTITNISYRNNMQYSNDTVVGYNYTVTLQGICALPETDQSSSNDLAIEMKAIKEIFSSNGSRLIVQNGSNVVLYALSSKVSSLNFNPSSDQWVKTIPFNVVIDFEHLHLGDNLQNTLNQNDIAGYDEFGLAAGFDSPYMVNLENYKIKEFEESFNMDISDEATQTLTLAMPTYGNDYSTIAGISQNYLTNTYFTITYTLSATGKHSVRYDNTFDTNTNKMTLPAWEHAKRWVHTRLSEQISSMFFSFMSPSVGTLNNNHSKVLADGIFYMQDPLGGAPSFGLFNENYVIDVSESDGTYSVQYSAIVKQKCPLNEYHLGCSNNTIHEIKKSISKTFVANEETNLENQEIVVTIDGNIRGLVPSIAGSEVSPFFIDNPNDGNYRGTFLVRQNTIFDKNDYADQLLVGNAAFGIAPIFDPFYYDFTEPFKLALGLTPEIFGVNPNVILRPNRMNLTRNFLEGTITYSAEYNNKYNCLESHFDTSISVEMPVPVIAEFTIPNNNVENTNDEVCWSGYNVIQQLGTVTAKKITVNINGNPGFDFGKCCIGTYDPIYGCQGNLDIYELSYFSLGDFIIPSGVNIPIIGDNYVLTNKQKTTNFPKGDFNITLEYICADVCEIEYFDDKDSSIIN